MHDAVADGSSHAWLALRTCWLDVLMRADVWPVTQQQHCQIESEKTPSSSAPCTAGVSLHHAQTVRTGSVRCDARAWPSGAVARTSSSRPVHPSWSWRPDTTIWDRPHPCRDPRMQSLDRETGDAPRRHRTSVGPGCRRRSPQSSKLSNTIVSIQKMRQMRKRENKKFDANVIHALRLSSTSSPTKNGDVRPAARWQRI